jgi:predicted acyltransferase
VQRVENGAESNDVPVLPSGQAERWEGPWAISHGKLVAGFILRGGSPRCVPRGTKCHASFEVSCVTTGTVGEGFLIVRMATATPSPSATAPPTTTLPAPERVRSLDVFRGLTIAAMILVNNPGSTSATFAPLRHAVWNGWTFADLIFPFFLFIVGSSLVFSCERRLSCNPSQIALVRHIAWRACVLIALGLMLNGLFYLPWPQVRIPGVLQRIGVVYFFGSLITLFTSAQVRTALTLVLLLGYWGLLMLTPVPGHGVGVLTPAGNLASFVDFRLLGGHLWRARWDPEGVLSTLPAIATLLLGTLVGEWLRAHRRGEAAAKDLTRSGSCRPRFIAGLVAVGLLAVLGGQLWGRVFPINKNLWTSSFTLFSGGVAALVFAVCYWLVDRQGWQRWGRPFLFMGMNPLAIYAASEIAGMGLLHGVRRFVYAHWLAPLLGAHVASVSWAIVYLLVWCCVAWLMYRKAVFIKL